MKPEAYHKASWLSMHQRCYNPRSPDFKNWGGKGIQVCLRWHKSNPDGLKNYAADKSKLPRPAPIFYDWHRISNDGHYMPSHCEWMETREHVRHHARLRNSDPATGRFMARKLQPA
jgi:hypothetical protein